MSAYPRRLFGRLIGGILRLFLILFVTGLPFAIGFVHFLDHLPPLTSDEAKTDAIVVLTGGSARIPAGLSLLEAGKAQRLFVSGVHPGVGIDELLKVDRAASNAQHAPDLADRIDLGDTAGDTFGNSVESVAWMRLNHFKSMRLVTADYHMPRALIEFQMEAPDIAILPHPVQPLKSGSGRWWSDRMTFNLLLGEYAKYLIAKWRYHFVRFMESR